MKQIMSLDDIDTLIADYVQDNLFLDNAQVMISYAEEGQLSPKIHKPMVYIHTEEIQSDVNQFKNRRQVWNSQSQSYIITQSSMRRLRVQFVFYGKHADEASIRLKEFMFFDTTKQFLYLHDLALIPDSIEHTNRIHEYINGRWWDRVDLNLEFYNSTHIEEEVGAFEDVQIDVVPDFNIVIN